MFKKPEQLRVDDSWASSKLLDYFKAKTNLSFVWVYIIVFDALLIYDITNHFQFLSGDLIGILLKVYILLIIVGGVAIAQTGRNFHLKKSAETFISFARSMIIVFKLIIYIGTAIIITSLFVAVSK